MLRFGMLCEGCMMKALFLFTVSVRVRETRVVFIPNVLSDVKVRESENSVILIKIRLQLIWCISRHFSLPQKIIEEEGGT